MRVALIALALAGCVVDAGTDELGSTEQALKPGDPGTGEGGCPSWGCGTNSPSIDSLRFHELNVNGLPNRESLRITSVWHMTSPTTLQNVKLDVVNAEILLKDPNTNAILYRSTNVTNTYIFIHNNDLNQNFWIKIVKVLRSPLWVHPLNQNGVTLTYDFQWNSPGDPTHLCQSSGDPDGITNYHAVVFENDRVDADLIRTTGEESGWFNIGCKGHALAKSHLLGYTKAAATLLQTTPTTFAQRTAVLKMLSGDYCGTGDPFTVPGQPLLYKTSNHYYDSVGTATNIEARWTDRGATCLNTPRVDAHPTTLSNATFDPNDLYSSHSTITQLMPSWCSLPPPCTGTTNDFQGTTVLSVNTP